VTSESFLLRGLLWFGLTSLGMVPYFLELRSYRRLIAKDIGSTNVSTVDLLDTAQVDPVRERARLRCRRRLFAGVAIYLACTPLAPLIFNA
jgi:hypothetical protein